MREELRDLKAMRVAAGLSAETMAARFRVKPDTFRDLENGDLQPSEALLEEWQRLIGLALSQRDQRRRAASRGLRRWFIKL